MELRSPPSGAPAPLETVLCTYALNRRSSRPPDYQGENRALAELASALAESPRTVVRKLVEAALELCQAGSAGISLLSLVDEGRTFHWPAVAGAWKRQAGRETLREALPCGLVLDRNAPQLFAQPALHYRDLSGIKPPIEEALVTPFYVNRRAVGTIWIFTHDTTRKIDREDMRILGTLGKFAADAYHLLESVGALQDPGPGRRERPAPRPDAAEAKRARVEGAQPEESELRKSEEKYRSLFNSIDEGFCIVELLYDPAGKPVDCKIIDVNPAFTRHSPLKVGDTVREGVPETDQSLFDIYGKVVESGEPIRIERYDRRSNRWFDVCVSRMGGDDSRQLASVFTDITARKRTEEEIRRNQESLHDMVRRKDEFLAVLGHELRNPLAAIRNAAQILRVKGGEDSTLQSASEMLDRQVGQMVRLVDDLLDVSRISRGKIELRRKRVELASVVNHAVEAVRPFFEGKGNELAVTLPLQKIHLDADPDRLSQVVGNLLNNACKFTKPGGQVKLAVDLVKGGESSEGEAVIRVKDNGVGIAADQLQHIFDLYVQADTSMEREQGGLGIGLALVKNLVEMHGGKVEAHSQAGEGSEFVVRLPVVIGTIVRES